MSGSSQESAAREAPAWRCVDARPLRTHHTRACASPPTTPPARLMPHRVAHGCCRPPAQVSGLLAGLLSAPVCLLTSSLKLRTAIAPDALAPRYPSPKLAPSVPPVTMLSLCTAISRSASVNPSGLHSRSFGGRTCAPPVLAFLLLSSPPVLERARYTHPCIVPINAIHPPSAFSHSHLANLTINATCYYAAL